MAINHAKVHFIVGKGGVGRTTVAEAMAQKFSSTNKTLLVTFRKDDSLDAHRLPVIEKIKTTLFYLDFSAEEAMREYLELKITSATVLEKIFGNSLFRALCNVAPGLSDLAKLGKIWFHADPINQEKAVQFDKIVVDMPSSGFVPGFLSIGATVKEAVKIGPIAHEAGLINDYLSDPNHALVHVVTLLEEIVVNETEELLVALNKDSQVAVGSIIANRVRMIDVDKAQKALQELPKEMHTLRSFLTDALMRTAEEKALLARLKKTGQHVDLIPEFVVATDQELKKKIESALP